MSVGEVVVGTCNWADHKHFYPPGLPAAERLAYYAGFFPLVEVDTTFYGIPAAHTAERWVEATPPGFRFNVKAYRSLTLHERSEGKAREPTSDEVRGFLDLLAPIREGGKLGGVHYQFPPWFKAAPTTMDFVARLVERHPDDRVIVEFRHRTWAEPERFDAVTELLAEAGMSYCIVDEPQVGSASMPPHVVVTDHRLAVVRFHGQNRQKWYVRNARSSTERFDYLYPEAALREWVPRIRAVAEEAEQVHVLFNNNRSNYAIANGLQMAELLNLGLRPASAVPAVIEPEQADLPL